MVPPCCCCRVYLAFQKVTIGLCSVCYLLWHSPQSFKVLFSRSIRLLVVISLCETLAVVLFLVSKCMGWRQAVVIRWQATGSGEKPVNPVNPVKSGSKQGVRWYLDASSWQFALECVTSCS